MQNLKIFIKTYGCQMNERDSETISALLQKAGHIIVTDENAADVVILNTCSVRKQAEIKAIGKSGYLARRKRMNPNFKIGMVGCMAENLGAKLFELNKSIDFVIGPRRLHELPGAVENDRQTLLIGSPQITEKSEKIENSGKIWTAERTIRAHNFGRKVDQLGCSAFLSIMQGCNMRCSYCIVPKTRGNELSRPMEDVLAEAKFLARAGVKEITLLGQIVNNYGERKMPMRGGNGENEKRGENGGKTPFVQLLHGLNDIGGIERIRYMSPHPRFFCNDLIAAHGSLPKLCPSVHLPIQSGSNRILKAMRRAYLGEMILEIVGKLRDSVAKIGISTDIIVGYPGETEEEFEKTVSLFCDAKFNMAFVFKYSPREGTQSATLADSVSKEDKERRNQILLQHVERASEQYNGQFVGTTVNVLVEGHAKRGENMMFGWTPEHCKVLFPAENNHIGKILPVKIDSATAAALAGSLTANRSTNN